jgi:hypothetical protein
MTCGEPKRQDDCRILQFPLRDAADRHRARTAKHFRRDIDPLLDLSRYEGARHTEDYKARMVENVAAVILLAALVAVATFDFSDLEQSQRCAYAIVCGP